MADYRRIVTGVSTFIKLLIEFDRLLVKYQDRIEVWAFDNGSAEQTQLIVNFMNSVHAVAVVAKLIGDD